MINLFDKRKMLVLLLVSVLLITLINGSVLAATKKITVQTPPVASALPILWMNETGVLGDDIELDIKISPDHQRAVALIAKNEIDMMITGVNVGAKIFNKGIDVKLLNTNIWAVDYLLTKGFKASSWADLRGKTLSLPLKGGPLDFLARYFLNKNGVDPEEVKLVYQPSANGARYFQLGKLDSIILPEPLVTVTLAKAKDAYLSLDLQEEWAKLHNGDDRIPYVGLFVSGKFSRENAELTERFNQYYKEGVNWVNSHPQKAAALGAKYFNLPAKVIRASFNRINLNCYPEGESFKLIEAYFNEILKIYPELIGGRLPNEYFYF